MCINILHIYMDIEVAQAQLGIVTLMVSSESVGQTVRCLASGLLQPTSFDFGMIDSDRFLPEIDFLMPMTTQKVAQ